MTERTDRANADELEPGRGRGMNPDLIGIDL
jgi:hypothetical protein